MFDDFIKEKIAVKKEKTQYRTRVVKQGLFQRADTLFFSGNDYLGLANHPAVVNAFAAAAKTYGVGSTASPMLVGYHEPHHALEEAIAEFLGFPRALIFSCGYMANLGVLSALCGRHDTIFLDRIGHASSIDAVKLSGAKLKRYRHADVAHLSERLQGVAQRRLIVTEGVFGMDGDLAPIPELSALAKKTASGFIVDDAHGFGIIGNGGRGVLSHFSLPTDSVDVYLATFGKAFGSYGAFAAGSEVMIDGLVQLARPYMFTTAMPPAIPASVLAGLQVLKEEPWRHSALSDVIAYFTKGARERRLPVLPSTTPIQVFMVGECVDAEKAGKLLSAQGILVSVIRPPTVPNNTSRLRISLNVSHTHDDLDRLLDALQALEVRCDSL